MFKQLSLSQPFLPRDTNEAHRAATPLELLFDLVSVIAIAAAAAGLHHAISENHLADGLQKFGASFFAIWWAWMNYTWYASAYDNDDAIFRVLTMFIMAGALVMAAGIQPFFTTLDLAFIVIGFVIMRLAMAALWLRAAFHDSSRRKTSMYYALGIVLAQVYWVGFMLGQSLLAVPFFYLAFLLGIIIELSVPILAERQGVTPWHRHHIIERYGLLNIIVLGETLLAGSMALGRVADEHVDIDLLYLAMSSLVILFSMWWLYFSKEDHLKEQRFNLVFIWGYGHLLIYGSGAAVGAGFAVMIDVLTNHSTLSELQGCYAVAIPVAVYFVGLWFVRDRFVLSGPMKHILALFSLLVLIAPPIIGIGGVAVATVLCLIARSQIACGQFESSMVE